MNNIIIPNNIIYIDNKSILIYIVLYILCNIDNINYYININNIIGYLYNTLDTKRSIKDNIKESLNDLCNRCIINKYNTDTYIINSSDLKVNKDYTIISYSTFNQLKTSPELLKHYIWIKKSMDYNIVIQDKRSVVSHMSYEYFVKNEGLAESTIKKYNRQLQDLQLIYINEGVYSLYENRGYADYWATYIKHNASARSVAAKYKNYCQNPSKYSEAKKARLRSAVVKYNEECKLLGEFQPDYLNKLKDLDIFDLF